MCPTATVQLSLTTVFFHFQAVTQVPAVAGEAEVLARVQGVVAGILGAAAPPEDHAALRSCTSNAAARPDGAAPVGSARSISAST